MGDYRVWLHSAPSPGLEYYSGYVDVTAPSQDEAGLRAIAQLTRTTFPDRPASLWTVDRVETRTPCRVEED